VGVLTPPSVEPVLQVDGLCIERGDAFAVRNIRWEVWRGQHWAILGPNGSGKTSLLRAVMGYFHGRGEVSLLGQRYGTFDWRELRAQVGLVSSALWPLIPSSEPAWLTVASGRQALLGHWEALMPKEEAAARDVLARMGGAQIADRRWSVLSQGERQRVLIARALVAKPSLLFLDEPCEGLDPVARERFLRLVDGLSGEANAPTLILVTHHVEEILPLFSHVLLLARGEVVASGPVAEVLTDALLSCAFEAPLNVACTPEGRWRLNLV
jgi:iron complex transport system ATP-binding protein